MWDVTMDIRCPTCGKRIALEDINPSKDAALCRRCRRTHSLASLRNPDRADVNVTPSGARFELRPGGFIAQATTRSWQALFLVPFTCVWVGGSVGMIYGRQLIQWRFDQEASLLGLPFLGGSVLLVLYCMVAVAGVVRVTREAEELEIFTGVGAIGWRRRYCWSDIRTVKEEVRPGTGRRGRNQTRHIVLDGNTRATFGSMLSNERRYFLIKVIRRMLAAR